MKTLKIKLPFQLNKPVLALGPQAKNTICSARGNYAYISPVHADLASPKDLSAFEKDARYFLKKHPKIIACDLHPEYQSSKFASRLCAPGSKPVTIQHHHAHIAACMAENGLKNQKVIGVAFDGTGLGADARIWGAEVLLCDYRKFWRAAHLKEIPLVGGERSILEPWRLLAAWLDFDKSVDKKQVLRKVCAAGINSPLASSMGRLFDAAASLILAKKEARFEAELAIALEKLAAKNALFAPGYKFRVAKDKNIYILDPANIFKRMIRDLKAKVPRERIAWRFHQSVAEVISRVAIILRKEKRINKVALSGGVFQNRILLKMSLDLLCKEGFQVLTHKYLSCNDACVSLGQAVVAGCRS